VSAELEEYRRKRDFGATPEPGADGSPGPSEGAPRFVVQRHDARALHFDLRLEVDGALASWSVPKGPPLREGVKRLAVRTEDHPLEYLTFAAVIPEGQYGAGRMTVWDSGTYSAELRSDREWKLVLEGGTLRGHYHLVRTSRASGGKEEWLIFRSPKGPPGPPDPTERFRTLRPMLAESREHPFDDVRFAFELKWDGYRALCLSTSEGTELRSRTGRDITATYPRLADLRRGLMCQEAVLDGEVVVLDAAGRARFGDLQAGRGEVSYMAYDLLYADGDWLLELPWEERRARLEAAVSPEGPPRLMHSDHVLERGVALYEAAVARDVEGIVAKRLRSPYQPGRRSPDWVKVKGRPELEAVIGGFTEGKGGRTGGIGALLVGTPEEGGLRYLGHVGSGLTRAAEEMLRDRLSALETAEPPFLDRPSANAPVHWVRPELRCEVAYGEITADGRLRAPVYKRLVEPGEPPVPAPERPAEPAPDGPRPDPAPAPDARPSPEGDVRLAGDAAERTISSAGRSVRLTNLRKPYWPEEGITKGDLLEHYLRVAEALVPHVAGRPLILKRYPNGIAGDFFFQHNLPDPAPDWLGRVDLSRSGRAGEATNRYAVIDDPMGLLWIVNLGCIDLNPWQSRASAPNEPTQVLFDLDPNEGVPFEHVVETALMVREELEALDLRGYPKTTGASGMHVFLPVPAGLSFDVVRLFAQVVAQRLVRRRPDLVTVEPMIANRGPRVYLDANQNGRGRSISSVYSVRPRPGAPVATPLAWDEVTPDLDPRDFTMAAVARRVAERGDLFAGALHDEQDLAAAVARLAGSAG
jgi:bifunctional non-homologous end joining protein LigD